MFENKFEVSDFIGLPKEQIADVSLELDTLRNQGILVDLNIGGTSIFQKKTNWFDLGIQINQEDEIRPKWLTAGSKFLIPEHYIKRLKSTEVRMRQTLIKYSFSISGFKPYRWIPFTAYKAFRSDFDSMKAEFMETKQEIIDRYFDFVNIITENYEQVARKSWKNVEAQGYEYLIIGSKGYSKQEFIELVIAEAVNSMPTVQKIEEYLQADYSTAMVFTPVVESNTRKAEAEAEEAQAKAKKAQLELSEKELAIRAMFEVEKEHARQTLENMKSPFEEVFQKIRNDMAEAAESMLESIKKNGFLKGKIANKGKGLLDWFDLMAIHDDSELREKLLVIKSQIADHEPENRDNDKIKETLSEISKLAQQETENVSKSDRFSMLEL